MKKIVFILVAVMVMSIFGATVAFAEEASEPITPESRFQSYLEKVAEKHNGKLDAIAEKRAEITAKASERRVKALEVVELVNADLLDDFIALSDTHSALHETLYSLNISLRTEFYTQFIDDVTNKYNELTVSMQAGDITLKEMNTILRAFSKEKHEEYKSTMENYKNTIADAKAANEILIEQIKAQRELMKEAVTNDDMTAANDALTNIMGLMVEHHEFDAYKISVLENIAF